MRTKRNIRKNKLKIHLKKRKTRLEEIAEKFLEIYPSELAKPSLIFRDLSHIPYLIPLNNTVLSNFNWEENAINIDLNALIKEINLLRADGVNLDLYNSLERIFLREYSSFLYYFFHKDSFKILEKYINSKFLNLIKGILIEAAGEFCEIELAKKIGYKDDWFMYHTLLFGIVKEKPSYIILDKGIELGFKLTQIKEKGKEKILRVPPYFFLAYYIESKTLI